MKYYTYIHYKRDTNEPFYIGHGFDRRWKQLTPRSEHWKEVVMNHGFRPEIIQHFETKEEAAEHETQLINEHRRLGSPLVNKSSGGVGGQTGNKKSLISIAKQVAKQTGQIRESITGNKNGRYKGPTIGTNRTTGEQIICHGEKDVVAAGFTWSAVNQCVNGKRPHHKNYTWSRLNT